MSKFVQRLLLLAAMMVVPWVTKAQSLSDYTLTVDTTTFTSIVSTGTSVSFSTLDDGYGTLSMPFAFPFGESVIGAGTTISLSANGFIDFASSTSGTTASYTSLTKQTINPILAQDGHMQRHTGAGTYYQVDTTGGVSCLTIEYHLLGSYSSPYGLYSYQVKLFQNGNIEFVYDSVNEAGTSRTLRTWLWDGLSDDLVSLSGPWASPTISTTIAQRPNTPTPSHGLRYTFTRPVITCPKPGQLTFFGIADDTASVSFVERGTATSWVLEYDSLPFVPGTGSGTVVYLSDTVYQFTGLMPKTTYYVYVQADCGGDTSLNRFGMFKTPCEYYPHDSLPYTQSFEGWVTGSTGSPDSWVLGDPCWFYGTNYIGSYHYPYVSTSYAHSGSSAMYMYKDGSSYYSYLCLPLFEDPINTLDFSCWIYNGSYSTSTYGVQLGVMTDMMDASTFNLIETLYPTATSQWQKKEVDLSSYTGPDGYLTLFVPTTANYCYAYIDDITVREHLNCTSPSNLTMISSVAADSVVVGWNGDGTAYYYDICYGQQGFNPDTLSLDSIITGISDSVYTLTTLMGGMTYDLYVRADCGSEQSYWTGPLTVTPGIIIMNANGTDSLYACGAVIYDDGGPSGNYSNSCNSTLYLYPSDSTKALVISGVSYTESSFDYLRIYEGYGTSGTVIFDDYGVSATQTFGPYETEGGPVTIVFHSDGSVQYSGFQINATCIQMSSCPRPTNFAALSLQADSVVVGWDSNDVVSSFEVCYGQTGFDPDTVSSDSIVTGIYDNFYTFTSLSAGYTYDMYVRADCDTGYSNWVGPISVTPGIFFMPTSGTDTIVACGGILYDDGGLSGDYSNSCNGAVVLRPSSPDSVIVVWGTQNSESNYDFLSIYDGEGTLGTPLYHQSGSNLTVPRTISSTGSLTVQFTSDGSVPYSGFELHVGCIARPNCAVIDAVTANDVAGTSAMIEWHYNEGSDSLSHFEVEYEVGGSLVSDVTPNSWYLVSGLEPGASHVFRVRSYCAENNGYGNWDSVVFLTGCLSGGDVNIGTTGSEMEYGPTYSCYEYAYSQSIYPSSVIGDANTFNGISWYVETTMNTTRSLTVYMGTTTQSSFSSENAVVPLSSLTQVATGTIDCSTTGWKRLNFTTPFVYDGTGNLVIAVDDNTGSYECTVGWRGTSTTSAATLCWYQDGTDVTPSNPTSADNYEMENYYPTIRLAGICDSAATCVAPNLFVVGVDTSSADLLWAPGYDETSWIVEYKAASDSAWTTAINGTTSTNYTITGLQPVTTYQFRVGSICSDTVVYAMAMVTTTCVPFNVPFYENFESWATGSNGTTPMCWNRMNDYSSDNYPYISTSYAYSGSKSMYMYSSNSSYSMLVLPEFVPAVDSLQISFALMRSNTSYSHTVHVGVMTDPNDPTTFTTVATVSPLSVYRWENFEIPLNEYEGTGRFIALLSPEGEYSYPYLDDIEVTYIPTCRRVFDVNATDITQTSAIIHWTDSNNAGDYEIEYGPYGFAPGTGTLLTSNVDSVALSGLTATTRYDVYVRSICIAGDTSNWSFCYTFSTACGDMLVPYHENFDSYIPSSSGEFSACWTKGSSYNSTYPYLSTSYHSSGSNSLYMYSSGTTYTYAATPRSAVPVDSLQVSMNVYRTSSTATYGEVKVGVMTDPTDWSTFTLIETIQPSSLSVWTPFTVYLNTYTDTGRYIAVATQNSGYDAVYIDDFAVDYLPSCLPPSQFAALLGNHDATISWNGNAASYEVRVGLAGFNPDTASVTIVTADSVVLTGLDSNTAYDIYVRGLCDVDDTSEMGNFSFTTLRSTPVSTYPYICTFADPAIANGWEILNGTQTNQWHIGSATFNGTSDSMAMYISNDNGTSNSYSISSTSNVYAYRTFNMPAGEYTISYDWKNYGESCCDYLRVCLVPVSVEFTAGNAGSFGTTTQPSGSIVLNSSYNLVSNWTNRSVDVTLSEAGVYNLVFFWHNDGSVGTNPPGAVDNVEVWRNTCPAPVNIHASSSSTSSIEVDWTDLVPATGYIVEYGLHGFNRGTGTVVNTTTHPVTVTGLDTLTEYDFYVQSICTDGDTGRWRMEQLTTSFCDNAMTTSIGSTSSTSTSYNYPVNNFYRYTLSETIIDSAELNGAQDLAAISYYYDYATPTTDKTNCTIYLQPTTKSVFTSSTDMVALDTTTAVRVYTGPLNCSQGWNMFLFDTTYSYDGTGNLLVIVDDNSYDYNGSSYVFKVQSCTGYKTITFYSDTYNPDVMSPSGFSGSTTYYTSRAVMRLTSCNGVSCPKPVITSVTHGYDSATIAWYGTGSTYQVNIKEVSALNWTDPDITVTGNTYTFTGLSAATNYMFRVRQDCTADSIGYGDWAQGGVLTDSLPCLPPTDLTVSDITNANGTFSWTTIGFESQWDLHVWNLGGLDTIYRVSSNPVTVGGYTAGVTYNAAIRAICGSQELEGEWSDTIQFATLTCPDVSGLSTSGVTESSVTLNWTADPMAQSWLIEYGFQGFAQGTGISVTTTTNSYIATGLDDETAYDFYVKAVCGTDWNSEGWTHVSATTLEAEDPTYTVTVSASDPSMGTVSGGGTYRAGETCTVTATPNAGFQFVNWSNGETANPYSFTVVSSIALTAYFQPTQGIDEVSGGATCSIYPNPTSSSTTISVEGVSGEVRISVVDMSGRTVRTETLECSGDCQKTMEVEGLAQGTYFVRITADAVNLVRKLVVK